jgi:hypothetical protein
MKSSAQIPIRASTQDHLDIEDIRDDIVIYKDGSCCLLLQTSAVNFGLLSEAEQDATIYAYAGLLNSLTFPIQIVVRSQKKDVTNYINLLKIEEQKQKNPKLSIQMKLYREFVETTVKENKVLDKKFYIVIPFSTLELGAKNVNALLPTKAKHLPFPKNYILERAKNALLPKKDHLLRLLNKIGLKAEHLNTQKLIELFYRTYNPGSGAQQITNADEYQEPLVQPAVEKITTTQTAQTTPSETATTTPPTQNTNANPIQPISGSIVLNGPNTSPTKI